MKKPEVRECQARQRYCVMSTVADGETTESALGFETNVGKSHLP